MILSTGLNSILRADGKPQLAMISMLMGAILIMSALCNNLMTKYGSEIPMTVLGIVMKINQILLAVLVGIPMYDDIFGTISAAESLLAKGVSLGTNLFLCTYLMKN